MRGSFFSCIPAAPVDVSEGDYYIRLAKDASFAMDIYNGSKDSGAKLTIYPVNNSGAQQFRLTKNSNGSYSIMNINSGMYLDAYSNDKTNGTTAQQYTGNGTEAQQWYIERNDDGTYSFRGVGSNLYLHIKQSKIENSNPVHLWSRSVSENSHWYLVPMGNSSATRLSGQTALDTMAQVVASWCVDSQGMTAANAGVATSASHYDALCGAALCGRLNSPLVLANDANASSISGAVMEDGADVGAFVSVHKSGVSCAYVFGGTSAVSEALYSALEVALA